MSHPMHEFRADLHVHTHFSDGSFSPEEVLQKAKEAYLQGISITDHDTVEAYSKELEDKSEKLGIRLLSGIEISCSHRHADIHILGYGLDYSALSLKTFLQKVQAKREERNRQILQKLKEHRMMISEEELYTHARRVVKTRVIGRPHIAEMMVKMGYVKNMQDAFAHYLRDYGPCYVPGGKSSPIEVIGEIHLVGGKAVLAHPHFIHSQKVVKELLQLPFDGIECYYGKLLKDQEKKWLDIVKEKNWIVTGGSDFHGENKAYITLGSSWVGRETFFRLLG